MLNHGGIAYVNSYNVPRPPVVRELARSYGPKSSIPRGTQQPYSFIMAQSCGCLASYRMIIGEGELSITSLSMGKAISAGLSGSGTITSASLSMIIQFLADLVGATTLSGSMVGKLEMAADLAGQGDLDSALSLIAWCVSNMIGSGEAAGTLRGDGYMSADITASGDLVTAASCAAAVWSALAAAYNDPGTMGNKMNSAASAGDPWTGLLENYTDDATFGAFVKKLLTTSKFIGLK